MKILASDFDNTLYVSDLNVFNENILAIKKFIREGNIFCIITGRNYSDLKVLLNKYNIPYSYLICQDGAKVFNNMDFCIDSVLLPSEKVNEIIHILDENKCDYFLDDGYNKTTNIGDCVKVVVKYSDKQKALQLIELIRACVDVYIYISSEHINIVDISVNKCNSLKRLVHIEKLNHSSIYVIGDEVNDLEMLTCFDGAIMKEHNSVLDQLDKDEYETLYQYIEELSKN